MVKLSGVIITYNEEENIEKCLQSLIDIVDEIVVVDSFSTDKTYDKLLSYNQVKAYQRPFDNFSNQKNYALNLAKNDWVLFIDADEFISEDYKKDVIQKINSTDNTIVAYLSAFKYYLNNERIRFSGVQTTFSHRLFKKSKCKYDANLFVHEKLIVDGKSGKLKHAIDHYSYKSIEHFKNKIFSYEKLKAHELYKKGMIPGFFHFYIKPAYKFLNNYFIRFGILDGYKGYKICLILAQGVYFRFFKLQELHKNQTD